MNTEHSLNDENQKLDKKLLACIEQQLMAANKVSTFEFEHKGIKYLADDLGTKIHFKIANKPKHYVGFAKYINKEISDIHFLEEPIHISDSSMLNFLSQQCFEE